MKRRNIFGSKDKSPLLTILSLKNKQASTARCRTPVEIQIEAV